MKYEIVEFRNRKFGIRRRDFFENLFNYGGDFLDLKSNNIRNYFWSLKSGFFIDCQTSDLTKLFENYSRLKNDYVLNVYKNGLPKN